MKMTDKNDEEVVAEIPPTELLELFETWLAKAQPGDELKYWKGNLAHARALHKKIDKAAGELYREYLAGRVVLTQRKREDGGYDYICTRCDRKPVQVRVPLSASFDGEKV